MENNRDVNGFIDPKERELMSFLTDPRKRRTCPVCKKVVIPVVWASQPLKVCPNCGNVIETIEGEKLKDCACVDSDARRCFEKRYVGTTLENEAAMAYEACECPCHDRRDEDGG